MHPDDRQQEFVQNKASIDHRDHLDRAFPSEYAAAKQEVRNARHSIKEINKQIKYLRMGAEQPTGPQLNRQDAGNVPRQTEDRIRALKYQRGQIRANTYDKVQEQTQHASPESQVRMHNATRKELQKGMSQRARDKQNSTQLESGARSMNRTQDRFYEQAVDAKQTRRGREEPRASPQPEAPAQNSSPAPQAADKGFSMSQRFSMTLSYTQSVEQPKEEPTKAEPQKEAPDDKPDKLSASDRFSNASSMNKAREDANNPQPNQEQPSKSPDSPTKDNGMEDI